MTLDYLKDLLFDALNESDNLPLEDLHWQSDKHCFELKLEDGSTFTLKCEESA